MPFVDTKSLPVIERLPGWRGRYFHTVHMTFAHYQFSRGASIHEHGHAEEERAGLVAMVRGGVRHSVRALTDGHAIVVDHPARLEFA
jgi:hypothetical protein